MKIHLIFITVLLFISIGLNIVLATKINSLKESENISEISHNMTDSSDHDNMTMKDMVSMVAGKSGDELDENFLRGMIVHHEGAVEMAKYLENAKHEELKNLGEEIISAQEAEIAQMKKWLLDWGYDSLIPNISEDHSAMGH